MMKYFAILFAILHSSAFATSVKSVTLSVSEKSSSEALASAVRLAVKKHLNYDPETHRAIFESEIIPYASQYVSSYKVISSARGAVNLNVTVDLSTIQSMLLMHASTFKKTPVRLLLAVRGFKGGSPWKGVPYESAEEILVSKVEAELKERVTRRKLSLLPRLSSYQEHIESLDANSLAMFRALSVKANADLVVFVDTKFIEANDDESIIEGLQLQVEMTMYEKSRNIILASSQESIPMNAGDKAITSKNEKIAEMLNSLIEKSAQDMWIRAGTKLLLETSGESYLTLRVVNPPNYAAILELKDAVQKLPKVNSILEREIERGRIDFWLDAAYTVPSLRKELNGIRMKEYKVALHDDSSTQDAIEISLQRVEDKDEKR